MYGVVLRVSCHFGLVLKLGFKDKWRHMVNILNLNTGHGGRRECRIMRSDIRKLLDVTDSQDGGSGKIREPFMFKVL